MATSNDFSDGIDNKKLKKKIKAGEDQGSERYPSNSFPIMTINMNGNEGTAKERRELLTKILQSFPSDIIFGQEIPGRFTTLVPDGCEATVQRGEAAVIWTKEKFDAERLKTTDPQITGIRDKLLKTGGGASELLSRISMVKLTTKQGKKSILAVSYHGPHVRISRRGKREAFEKLLEFLSNVIQSMKISSYIIGGDFNIDTLKDVKPPENVAVSSYTQENSRGIPHKDNFVYCPKTILKVSRVRVADKISAESDLTKDGREKVQGSVKKGAKEPEATKILDHDPIVGDLVFKDTPDIPKGGPKSSSKVTDESVKKITKGVKQISLK